MATGHKVKVGKVSAKALAKGKVVPADSTPATLRKGKAIKAARTEAGLRRNRDRASKRGA